MVAAENTFFLGTGGDHPQLIMSPGSEEDSTPTTITEFPRGNSVYAIAVSPDGTRLAAAARTGEIRVYPLNDFRVAPDAAELLVAHHRPGVTGLSFCTGDVLASGGLDGHARFWSVSRKQLVADLKAHSNTLLSMCRIGSLLLATLGTDGALRVWDLDSLEPVFTRSELDLPETGGLASLQYDPVSGLLMHPTSRGEVILYDMRQDGAFRTVRAHQGGISAIASNGNHVATVGFDDGLLRIWSCGMDRTEMEGLVGGGIVSLSWAADRAILSVDRAGSCRLWQLDQKLQSSTPLGGTAVRSCRGLPPEIIVGQRLATARSLHDSTIEEAKSLLARTDADSQRRLCAIIADLERRGCSIEAGLLGAEAARMRARPVDELEALVALTEFLGNQPAAVPALYALGDVLWRLNETALAAETFQKVLSIEPEYQDTQRRLVTLEAGAADGNTKGQPVRGDLGSFELAIQELRKCNILRRCFTTPILLESRIPLRLEVVIKPCNLVDALTNRLNRMFPNGQRIVQREVSILTNGHVREAEWVCVNSLTCASAVGFEFRTIAGGCEITTHVVLDVPVSPTAAPSEHNQSVEKALNAALHAEDGKSWVCEIERVAMGVLHQLRNSALSQTSDGLF